MLINKTVLVKNFSCNNFAQNEYMKAYKQARRREDDIAIVNAAFKVTFQPGTKVVEKFTAAFGGMAATTVMPKTTMKKIIGR